METLRPGTNACRHREGVNRFTAVSQAEHIGRPLETDQRTALRRSALTGPARPGNKVSKAPRAISRLSLVILTVKKQSPPTINPPRVQIQEGAVSRNRQSSS